MVKDDIINVRLSKKLKDETIISAKLLGLNLTEYVTRALIHENNGRGDYSTAVYELNALSEYLDGRLNELNVTQNVTQKGDVIHTVTQTSDETPSKLEDVSQRPLKEITTLDLAVRYVQDKVFHKPFISSEMIERLSSQVGITSKEFLNELEDAGVSFTMD